MSYPIGEASTRAKHRQTAPSPATTDPAPPATFRQPDPQQAIPRPSPSPSPSSTTSAPDAAGIEASPARPSTPAPATSAPKPAGSIGAMSERGLTEAAKAAFRGSGEALNQLLAEERPDGQPADDIWLATDAEADGVAKPAGRLMARRMPDLPGGDASDTADLVALAIPLGIWAVRGIAATVPRVMRARRQAAVTQAQQQGEQQ